MALIYFHLDARTRQFMAEELAADVAADRVYAPPRVVPERQSRWRELLTESIATADDDWLAAMLRRERLIVTHEPRRTKHGVTMVSVGSNAADILAEGEFNRYYMRGLCRRAEVDLLESVVVFRAKHVESPRPTSQRLLGSRITPARLLADLRLNVGVDTALGVPAGPNSGLSVKLPTA